MVFKLVVALALALSADARKLPSKDHQNEMKRRLQDAAKHVMYGGPRESKLERVNELLETHGGFVTDMITTYRPSLISKWLKKAYDVRALSKAASSERRLSKNDEDPGSDTGACYDTHHEEFNCVVESCWCDRALDQSDSGPDVSSSCDDSSEYASYACDVSMLALDCKIAADTDCIPVECEGMQCEELQDDWAIRYFTNGSSRVIESDDAIEDANDDCRGWPLNCCGSRDCTAYDDETCETAATQCAPFTENVWSHDSPSPAPTWSACDGNTTSSAWMWHGEFDGYRDDGFNYDAAACTFSTGVSASYSSVAAATNTGRCSQEWCTSPDGNNGEDCWAGSDSEPCTCSQGEARETGETIEYEGDLYYGYTCCTSGNNEGEHCGDYEGGIVVLIVFLLFVCCFIGCGVGIGVCICKVRGGDDDVWW